jgi:hypothetical protein
MKTTHHSSSKLLRPLTGLLSLQLLLALSTSAVFGQGTVKGVITDKADNEPLIAVNVLV